jgi:hypothetical protein
MSFRASFLVAAVAVAALSPLPNAWAQGATGGQSRADVKAETRAAQKAGALVPAGETSPRQAPQTLSSKTRHERKAETIAAGNAGELRRTGQEPEWKTAREAARVPSTRSRPDRKATTVAAARAGRLTPPGEGSPAKQ